jgi:Carboxypeptidase regulatory-like domain
MIRMTKLVNVDRYGTVRLDLIVRFPRFPIILGLLVMTACVCVGQTPSVVETGIEGVITISPTQPGPIRADSPGSKPLANAAFVVESEKGEVASFTTDNEGRFRIPLAPGHYRVSIKGKKGGIGRFGPFEVDVVPGKVTNVQWECDSGIR